MAIYSDRHPAFKFTGDISRYLAGPAQFARAMEELGIRQIFARSPQAKGRVERAAATFQDRLVTELRLAGAATIDEASEVLSSFLPRFNERFGVPAEQDCPAYRPVEHWVSLEQTLCFRYPRKVARDNTLKYHRRTLQLLPDGTRPSYAGLQAEVQEDLEGRLLVQYLGQTIPNQEAPPRPSLLKTTNSAPPDEHHRGPMARQRTLWEEGCNRPGFVVLPFGQSPGSWASTGTPRRSTPRLKASL